MDVNKDDVKRLVEHLELPYFYAQLNGSLQHAKNDATDVNLQRLVAHHQVATDKCIEANATKQTALWNTETRHYFNAFVDPIWTLLGESRQFIRKKGLTPTFPVPRPLSPTPLPRSRKPSFTVADYVITKKTGIGVEGGAGVASAGGGSGGDRGGGGGGGANNGADDSAERNVGGGVERGDNINASTSHPQQQQQQNLATGDKINGSTSSHQ